MASAKVFAKLQADQNSITQLAEHHSKQGSNLSNSSLAKKASLAAQRWHQNVLANQASAQNKVKFIDLFLIAFD